MMIANTEFQTFIARSEVIIESHGISNAVAALIKALENIEQELIDETFEFEGSQHHKNIEHQKQVLEFSMSAVDLDTKYGSAEARKVTAERFVDDVKSLGVMA